LLHLVENVSTNFNL